MGLHVARNSTGFFSGIWSDMLIETTFMKFGGLVGVTSKPKSVIRWAYSFHKISIMIKELKEITDTSNRGGGGGSPWFFEKLDFEIAVDQQPKSHDKTFEGVPDSGCPPVPAGQPHPYLVNFWLNFAKSP